MNPSEPRELNFSREEIREKYDRFASKYDLAEAIPEIVLISRWRRKLLAQAEGEVLEAGVGTGKNLPYYPRDCILTGVDLSEAMLEVARKRARRLRLDVSLHRMDVEHLLFPDESFDTVVDSMNLCTYPHPASAIRELARVCRTRGRLLLLEHGRSDRSWLGRFQDRRAASHARTLGCVWNRDPLAMVKQAGLEVLSMERNFFGIFTSMVARP